MATKISRNFLYFLATPPATPTQFLTCRNFATPPCLAHFPSHILPVVLEMDPIYIQLHKVVIRGVKSPQRKVDVIEML